MILVDKPPRRSRSGRSSQESRRIRENRPGAIDRPGSRSLGGLLAEPITRHAYPQNLSDAAFYQLVDGDPGGQGSHPQAQGRRYHRPDPGRGIGLGDPAARVGHPATKTASLKDPKVAKQTYEMIYEVKLKEAMQAVFKEILKGAAIENQFAGAVKLANEEKDPSYGAVDGTSS